MWHPLSANVGTNFADTRRSICQYSSPQATEFRSLDENFTTYICCVLQYMISSISSFFALGGISGVTENNSTVGALSSLYSAFVIGSSYVWNLDPEPDYIKRSSSSYILCYITLICTISGTFFTLHHIILATYSLYETGITNTTITLGIWKADHLAGVFSVVCCLVAQRCLLLGHLDVRWGEHYIESCSGGFLL
jgi:hypothetical protein